MDTKAHHIGLTKDQVGSIALLPGDPGRVPLIASHLEDAHFLASHREYTSWGGMLSGVPITVMSTGIGCPSTAIAVEELVTLGCKTFIRVGTAGLMQSFMKPGDFVVAQAAVRDEGTSQAYMPLAFPAVADFQLTNDLQAGLKVWDEQVGVHVGTVHSKDAYYAQHGMERLPTHDRLKSEWEAWKAAGVLCSEMEAATLYTVGAVLGVKCSGIMMVGGTADGRPETPEEAAMVNIEKLAEGAVAALKMHIEKD